MSASTKRKRAEEPAQAVPAAGGAAGAAQGDADEVPAAVVPREPMAESVGEDVVMSGQEESKGASEHDGLSSLIIQLQSMEGTNTGPQLDIPADTQTHQLEQIVNELLSNKEATPYAFYVSDMEMVGSLRDVMVAQKLSAEGVLVVQYQPLATFRVIPVTRCTDTIPGHTDAVLHVSFAPDGSMLASGGGDGVVRFYESLTSTPMHNCTGHKHHVLCTAWSPDGQRFVSGDKTGEIRVWNPRKGALVGNPLRGHKQWITSFSWEPMHRNAACERFASASKDHTIKIWNVRTGRQELSLSGHTDSVECVKWGGEGLLYSASRDRTVRVWTDDGKLIRSLTGHAHRVNALALSTDYVCRTGAYDHNGRAPSDSKEAAEAAKARYDAVRTFGTEKLVSCSDDYTLYFWDPTVSKQPICRMTGHQQAVNHISFSPDARFLASASFDKKVKLWDGRTGRFIATLTGHVGAVYQVCWSSDSRYLASASKDSTVKIWQAVQATGKATSTLAGHADEVYALDWSPNGERLASGSKDRLVKIWRH